MFDKNESSAFPSHGTMGEVVETGMTLRDYFAAKAMRHFIDLHPTQIWNATFDIDGGSTTAKQTAKAAYFMADAMLAEREAK